MSHISEAKAHQENVEMAFLSGIAQKYPLLSQAEHQELGKRVHEQGDEKAREKLVLHNMRLVWWLARRWVECASKKFHTNLEFSDLVQEGVLGLVQASRNWDYRRAPFPTYARWYIQNAIKKKILESNFIAVPKTVVRIIYKIESTAEELAREKGRPPTEREIAKALNQPQEYIRTALTCLRMDLKPLQQEINKGNRLFGGSMSFEDVVPSGTFLAPDRAIEAKQELYAARTWIQELIQTVHSLHMQENRRGGSSERNRAVFLHYYGLDDRTLARRKYEDLAEKYGFSKQRAAQIVKEVWKRLEESQKNFTQDRLQKCFASIVELKELVAAI